MGNTKTRTRSGHMTRLLLSSLVAFGTVLSLFARFPNYVAAAAVESGTWKDITYDLPYKASGIAMDSHGDLFVTANGNQVEELPSGATSWKNLNDGHSFVSAAGIAVDAAGDLFVVDPGSPGVNYVQKLPAGTSTWQSLTYGYSFNQPDGIAVDSTTGNVYVSSWANIVYELPGSTTSWQNITNSFKFANPVGVAVDSRDNVYVVDYTGNGNPNTVDELPSGGGSWLNITHGGAFKLGNGIATGSTGDVFVTNYYNNTYNAVQELPHGTMAWQNIPLNGFAGKFAGAAGIAVDSSGDLFVANSTAGLTDRVDEYIPFPPAPANVSSGSTTYDSTTLMWNAVSGAKTYNVYEDGGSTPLTTGLTGTSTTVRGLTPGTSYTFTVTAVTLGGESVQSSPTTVSTSAVGSVAWSGTTDVRSGASETVTGVVYDVYHAPVANAIVDFSGTIGTWSAASVTTGNNGAFSIGWTAPVVKTTTTGTVTATVYGTVYGKVSNVTPTSLAMTIAPPPSVTTTTLTSALQGIHYTQTINATGGFAPYTWSLTSGSLPSGMTLNANTGAISGTPLVSGTSTFTAQVEDADGNTATQSLSITVGTLRHGGGSSGSGSKTSTTGNASLAITTSPVLHPGQPGQMFSQTITATGGTGSYTWKVVTGTLPAGLVLDEKSGVISGTTKSTTPEVLTVQATDAHGSTQTKQVVVDVVPKGAREVVWQTPDLHAENVPSVVHNDAANPTTYMPIWYVMQILHSYGVESTWDGHDWHLIKTGQAPESNPQPGVGTMHMYLNGQLVQNVSGLYEKDPSSRKLTTFMPIWYVMQILQKASVTNTWDGTTWNIGLQGSTGQTK
ncbi:putative Ig domain-containing protein [Alicyclobacillus curvatus]|nr:putative Ig domain-containing protein [Alicyclobacillus curvatus]